MKTINLFNMRKNANEVLKFLQDMQSTNILNILGAMDKCERYLDSNGVLCFMFNGCVYDDMSFKARIKSMNKILNTIYNDEIDQMPLLREKDGLYYLGKINENFVAEDYIESTLTGGELIFLDNKKTVEVCENGLICKGFLDNMTIYHSKNKLEGILKGGWYQFYDNEGKNNRTDLFTMPRDGLYENMLEENLLIGRKSELIHNQYKIGVLHLMSGIGERYTFKVGQRQYDNEAEAIFSYYLQNLKDYRISNKAYLFNPALNHINQREGLERYIRGEITEKGLFVRTLQDVAENPLLVLRYDLAPICKQYGVSVAGFQINDNGYMTNKYGVSYKILADHYFNGLLTKEEIRNQKEICSLENLVLT